MSAAIEQELIQQCKDGNPKAQRKLYDLCSRAMYGVCLRYSSTAEDARDILQEGFIKIFTRLNQYSGKGSFEGWIKRIFINTALEHYRVNKVYREQSDVEQAYQVHYDGFSLESISRKELLEILNGLAPGYRSVLNLYAIEGYSHAEIAEIMGISEGTSKSQLSRARFIFMQELNKRNKTKTAERVG